jgi:CheY-like chemotaxis protein
VADDDPVSQKVAVTLLKKLGCEVEVADSGPQFLDAMKSGRYDAVLVDEKMAELEGFETVRGKPSGIAPTPMTRVIVLTSQAPEDGRKNGLVSGLDEFLAKPVRMAALKEILARIDRDKKG